MVLNWTIEVYLSFISVILTLFASGLILQQNFKNPDKALVIMSSAYFFLAIFFSITGFSYLLLEPVLFMAKNIFLVFICLTITMTTNQMINGTILSYQLVFVSFFSSFAIVPYFFPLEQSVEPMTFSNGAQSLQNIGFNRIIIAILFLYVIFTLLYFSIKIYRHSPGNLRRDASLYFIGNILIIFAVFSFVFGISTTIPGIVELFVAAGILVSTIGLIRAPQILYVLPFSAIKLSIIRADSGVSFYNYYWQGNLDTMSDQLFGAAFLAITNFMKETVGEGNIQSVKLEDATMTISKSEEQSIYYVVIATKPSYVLTKGLEQFVRSFNEIYGDLLADDSNYEVQQFQEADKLIPKCFPYIPKTR